MAGDGQKHLLTAEQLVHKVRVGRSHCSRDCCYKLLRKLDVVVVVIVVVVVVVVVVVIVVCQ